MNRVDRLLAIILYLQSRRYCTAEMMAEHFTVGSVPQMKWYYQSLDAVIQLDVE